jgi:hypothetical protein
MGAFTVNRIPAFDLLAREYAREHPKLEADLEWITGRLAEAPDLMGDHVPELRGLALPIFKTRCKDTCHRIGASGAWRIYYAVNKPASKVFLLFPASQEGIPESRHKVPPAKNRTGLYFCRQTEERRVNKHWPIVKLGDCR